MVSAPKKESISKDHNPCEKASFSERNGDLNKLLKRSVYMARMAVIATLLLVSLRQF